MVKTVNMSYEDKVKMYNKLSKKELIEMLIASNCYNDYGIVNTFKNIDQVPYSELCGCNPKNGGSGICGCTLATPLVTTYNI